MAGVGVGFGDRSTASLGGALLIECIAFIVFGAANKQELRSNFTES